MKSVASALLLTIVGFVVGGVTAGLATCFVYFLGGWIGAPVGAAFGAGYGSRIPLRDATLIFVTHSVLFWLAVAHFTHLSQDPYQQMFVGAVWGIIIGPGGFFLPRLPLLLLSFEKRRLVAMVIAAIWAVVFLTVLYQQLCVIPTD